MMKQKIELVEIDKSLLTRSINEGFSGGEKKRNEIFQMAMLEPKLAILDETDSGLDIDALRIVANGVNKLRNAERGIIVITHYQRLLDYLQPDFVHVLVNGRIVKSGTKDLALELEEKGYDFIKDEISLIPSYKFKNFYIGFKFTNDSALLDPPLENYLPYDFSVDYLIA